MEFITVSPSNVEFLKNIMSLSNNVSCDFTPGNMLMWGNFYQLKFCIIKGFLVTRIKKDNIYFYSFPFGQGDISEAIEELLELTEGNLRLYSLSPEQLLIVKKLYPDRFSIYSSEYGCEYVYKASALAELPGRKYHQKKNFINRFYKTHINVYSKEIKNEDDLELCKCIANKWFFEKYGNDFEGQNEYIALNIAFSNYFKLDFKGMILFADGLPVAFTIGEEINSFVFNSHFEKTLPEYRDAYPVINKEFATFLSSYRYINREDDAGEENLKKAKLSYHPDMLIHKFDLFFDKNNNVSENTDGLKKLWKETFGDEDKIIESFFANVYKNTVCFDLFIDNVCASAFYLIPCRIKKENDIFQGFYLYAATTNENYRQRGLMSALISSAVEYSADKDFLILFPANSDLREYYRKLGFEIDIQLANGDTLQFSEDVSVDEYFRNIDEMGFVCYPKEVYKYYKTFADSKSVFNNTHGVGIIFNDKLSSTDIIIKDTL